jgi:hypothetical protein
MKREVSLPDEIINTSYSGQDGGKCYLVVCDWIRIIVWILLYALNEITRLSAELFDANNKIIELESQNQKLFELSHLDSETSGIPSSKDWKKNGTSPDSENTTDSCADKDDKTKETPTSISGYLNNKDGEKRNPGGQKNHTPAFMRVDGTKDEEPVLHYPKKCTCCPHIDKCIEEGRFRRYFTGHGYDIEIIRVHREHQLFEATDCLEDEGLIHDDFPEVIGSQFYDTNVQLHVLTWHHIFHGSYDRVALAAKELLNLSLSAGTANAIIQRIAAKILGCGFMDALRFFVLLFDPVAGVDETSAGVAGRNAWVHTVATDNVTLLSAHWRRGFDGTIYAGVVQFFTNTLISDCWAAYFKDAFGFKHAICDAHILRELVAAAYFRQQHWAIEMFDLLLEVFGAKRDAIEQGHKSLPQEYIDDIKQRYRQIVVDGYIEIAGQTKGKTFALLERLRKLEDAALAFAVDFNVDFTNNMSEISLRNLKVTLRVIGQFKTMPGLVDYCIIQSFMDTCRKQGLNPFDMMRVLLSGGDIIEAVFGAEKAAMIKQMIRLTNAFAQDDPNAINDIKAEMGSLLTDELVAAASYGSFKAYNDPPPEKKNSSPDVPKDKMKAAREKMLLKKASLSTTQTIEESRAGPICA